MLTYRVSRIISKERRLLFRNSSHNGINTLVVDRDMNLAQLQARCDEFAICVTRKQRDELESNAKNMMVHY
jgi:hypothetical protein